MSPQDRKSPSPRSKPAIAATLLALAALALTTAPAAAAPSAAASAFCEDAKPVEDFGLSALPPTHEAPTDGDLPFAPKTVSLNFSNRRILAVGEGIGFWLNSQNYSGRTPLHWVLRDRLRPVDDFGTPGPVIARGRQRVRLIHAGREVKLFLDPPRTPGFYRYEIEIADFDGRRLALYSSHIRVERKFWDVRLGLNRTLFHPGNHVFSRLENFGTLSPAFGEEFRLQRLVGSQWRHVKIPGRSGWLLWAGFLLPGSAASCDTIALPRDFPPGHYRIVKEVERYLRKGHARTYYLTAPFEVIPRIGSEPLPPLPQPRTVSQRRVRTPSPNHREPKAKSTKPPSHEKPPCQRPAPASISSLQGHRPDGPEPQQQTPHALSLQ